MARVEERKNQDVKKNVTNVFLWVGIGIVTAIIITLIVILTIWFFKKNKGTEEQTFEETYPTAELITFSELKKILENENSDYRAQNMFIYVYSPDYETYPNGKNEELQAAVKKCGEAYKDSDSKEYAFYVINVTSEDNKKYLEENTTFLTDYSLSSTYPYLLEFKDGVNIEQTYTKVKEMINYLDTAYNNIRSGK